MLNITFIRDNAKIVQQAIRDRGGDFDIQKLLLVDRQRRELQQEVEVLRHEQHEANQQIAKSSANEKKKHIEKMKHVATKLKEREVVLSKTKDRYNEYMLLVPNIPDASTPVDPTGKGNVVRKEHGTLPIFDFKPQSHIELGKLHDIIDFERGVKISGTRGYVIKGNGVTLQNAVFALGNAIARKHNFTLIDPPVMVKERFLLGTGHFPAQREEIFEVHDKEHVQFLVGTAEVPLMGYYADETLKEQDLPYRLAAFSPCFRTEVGSYGKDTKGLYRVRQFYKLEQLIICKNDEKKSKQYFQELLGIAEEVLQALELPYRMLQICTGDMGQGKVEEWDIETWMPSREAYGETHTCSRFHEFQARRLNIKYKDSEGIKKYAHTLNNTIVASPRILIPILENHQQSDGSIRIPKALRPFMDNQKIIKPTI